MKSFEKKDSLLKTREAALKKNLKKRKKFKISNKRKNVSSIRQMDKTSGKDKRNDQTLCRQASKKG